MVFGLALRWPRAMGPALGVALTVLTLGASWIPAAFPDPRVLMTGIEYLPNSAVHRIVIWQTTAKHIHERPWLGHGFDTSRSLYSQGAAEQVHFARPTVGKSDGFRAEPIPLHPHNMALQVWLELGAVGVVLVLGALQSVLAVLSRMPLSVVNQAAGHGFFVAALSTSVVAYGAWQAWWLSALGLCVSLLTVVLFGSRKSL